LVKAERDPAVFFVTVGGIKDRKRLGITENRRGTLKTGAMVAQIFLGLPGVALKNIPQRATSIAGCHGFTPVRLAAKRQASGAAGSGSDVDRLSTPPSQDWQPYRFQV
jgi:hypothetical protein